jgi:rhodanese-related sulfurtransferase
MLAVAAPLLVVATTMAALPSAASELARDVSPAEVRSLKDQGAVVIDVRRADEWRQTGIVDGSRLITAFDANGRLVPAFTNQVQAVAGKNGLVVLICRTGNRSAAAAKLLADAGYDQVFNAAGGITRWQAEGQTTVPCPSC